MIEFWWRSASPSGYRDCLPDSSLLGNTESGISGLWCTMLQCMACTNRHHHSNYDVITSPALGGGMHCPSASTSDLFAIEIRAAVNRLLILMSQRIVDGA